MKIVFICTGNTCRSPMADGIFKELLRGKDITDVESGSAGLSAFPGMPATDNAVRAAAELGADISGHRASSVTQYLLDSADFFICMTHAHADTLLEYLPSEKVTVLGEGVPDPYGGDLEDYRTCALTIKKELVKLINRIFPEEGSKEMNSYSQVDFKNMEITGGFWQARQTLNRDVTLDAVRRQFENTGRFEAFKCNWKEGMPKRPHIFWDSDIAKWLESAAFILSKNKDAALEQYVDDVVDLLEKNQWDDGYFNIFFTVVEPEERFQHRMEHELYCAGHLMEAAVAYYDATGKDKFLNCMKKYADFIERVFKIENSAEFSTPGHEEIELALVKLYHCTGEKRYLELSRHFIDARGAATSKEVVDGENDTYLQDHLPVREQTTAEGHSVRACYLYSGMADIAREYGDVSLLEACERLFDNIAKKRMYITGGIGSTRDGERFTGDYDLPNDTAYAETCAAIALAMFAGRMSLVSADSKYADMVERTIYNGIISGISLDGKSFFYENPLEINLTDRNIFTKKGKRWPITQRVEVFDCSCCPPNMTRFVASVGGYVYSHDDDTAFVHQFMESKASFDVGGSAVSISQTTSYPDDGSVTFAVSGMKGKKLAVRIPSWCSKFSFVGVEPEIVKGYAYINIDSDDVTLVYNMDMTPKWYESSARVWADAGKVALTRGPLVYCMEGVDNGPELWSFFADIFSTVTEYRDEQLGALCLEAKGYKKAECYCGHAALYHPADGNYLPAKLKFIPYYVFANRGETDMAVWVGKQC